MPRTIVGGIGYPDLCDHSIGVAVQERLALGPLPPHVSVEELSYNPIALVQRLQEEPPERRFERMVAVSAVHRGTRPPATVRCYRWDGVLPPADEIHAAVSDAVTGIIALENTIAVAGYFGALPAEVVIVEVEPAVHEFGAALSAPLQAIFDVLCDVVKELATSDEAVALLPTRPLTFAVAPGMRVL